MVFAAVVAVAVVVVVVVVVAVIVVVVVIVDRVVAAADVVDGGVGVACVGCFSWRETNKIVVCTVLFRCCTAPVPVAAAATWAQQMMMPITMTVRA